MDLTVKGNMALWGPKTFKCAIGRSGFASQKREGDGTTPIGSYRFRKIYFRPDRIEKPFANMPSEAITSQAGWCDDPKDPQYNRFVNLPFGASHEKLWRADQLYDLLIVVGHNDNPPVPYEGSAVFIHVAREQFSSTEGCVAFTLKDLLCIVENATIESNLVVMPELN